MTTVKLQLIPLCLWITFGRSFSSASTRSIELRVSCPPTSLLRKRVILNWLMHRDCTAEQKYSTKREDYQLIPVRTGQI